MDKLTNGNIGNLNKCRLCGESPLFMGIGELWTITHRCGIAKFHVGFNKQNKVVKKWNDAHPTVTEIKVRNEAPPVSAADIRDLEIVAAAINASGHPDAPKVKAAWGRITTNLSIFTGNQLPTYEDVK